MMEIAYSSFSTDRSWFAMNSQCPSFVHVLPSFVHMKMTKLCCRQNARIFLRFVRFTYNTILSFSYETKIWRWYFFFRHALALMTSMFFVKTISAELAAEQSGSGASFTQTCLCNKLQFFHGCKNDNFQMKNYDVFLTFAQNIDCRYSLDPPHYFCTKHRLWVHVGGSNEYLQSMF